MEPNTRGPKVIRVLVCDDEKHVTRLLQVNLERQGYLVRCAYSGHEAIELLKTEKFDRAIIDVVMPDTDGYQVLRRIRENPETEKMWVALMTARADDWQVSGPDNLHADRYVTKPFNPAHIFDHESPAN